ncbi:hypothetical protein MGG_17428 [Pyricularia oryzae 70-15]|uniref:Uncharacterized protein n=3 Tax=Pyricularia oryzae TaxID=318829 RepID=G4NBF1_PYRO7|nr:uncharacterized protein MGG_17428 [Pyricularia oryzae 70-15]EHA48908.1 hypothetical protein MGG_17428 [Pyricularia oryzae 70-15]ELQ38906.1 hypothetical protein OOU_Y34scaffold00522g61 [Pyricularia oryzae Y34]
MTNKGEYSGRCTTTQNLREYSQQGSRQQFRGTSFCMSCNKWLVSIPHDPKQLVFVEFLAVHILAARPGAELNLLRQVCPGRRITADSGFVFRVAQPILPALLLEYSSPAATEIDPIFSDGVRFLQ